MKFTAEQIAGILEGEVVGNPKAEVQQSKIEEERFFDFYLIRSTTTTYIQPRQRLPK
jgi:hypothetical protein